MHVVLHLNYICLPVGVTAIRKSSAATAPKSVFIPPASVVQIAMAIQIY